MNPLKWEAIDPSQREISVFFLYFSYSSIFAKSNIKISNRESWWCLGKEISLRKYQAKIHNNIKILNQSKQQQQQNKREKSLQSNNCIIVCFPKMNPTKKSILLCCFFFWCYNIPHFSWWWSPLIFTFSPLPTIIIKCFLFLYFLFPWLVSSKNFPKTADFQPTIRKKRRQTRTTEAQKLSACKWWHANCSTVIC